MGIKTCIYFFYILPPPKRILTLRKAYFNTHEYTYTHIKGVLWSRIFLWELKYAFYGRKIWTSLLSRQGCDIFECIVALSYISSHRYPAVCAYHTLSYNIYLPFFLTSKQLRYTEGSMHKDIQWAVPSPQWSMIDLSFKCLDGVSTAPSGYGDEIRRFPQIWLFTLPCHFVCLPTLLLCLEYAPHTKKILHPYERKVRL